MIAVSLMRLPEGDHEEARNKQIGSDDQYGCGDHGLGGGAAHTLGASGGGHAVETADGRDEIAEDDGLGEAHDDVLENEGLVGGGPVLVGVEPEERPGDDEAAGHAEEVADDAQEEEHHDGGNDARGDEFLQRMAA